MSSAHTGARGGGGSVADALEIRALSAERGGREVLRGIDLTVAAGEVCVLMGASGSGKSTALRTIAALQPFSAGSITVSGFALQPGPAPRESQLKPLRAKVGMVFQAHALFEHLTALQNVVLAPHHALGWPHTKCESVARELLKELGVDHRADAFPKQLSGGEAQRVAIARALAPNPTLLLMDEPTSALDPSRRETLGETLRELASAGRALVIATHDREWAERFADRVVTLADGRLA